MWPVVVLRRLKLCPSSVAWICPRRICLEVGVEEEVAAEVPVLQCFPDVTIFGLEEEAVVEEVLVQLGQQLSAAAALVLVVAGERVAPSQ